MRESLTPDQLLRRKQLIDEGEKKRADDPEHDWIVYADSVILRSEIHIFRTTFQNKI